MQKKIPLIFLLIFSQNQFNQFSLCQNVSSFSSNDQCFFFLLQEFSSFFLLFSLRSSLMPIPIEMRDDYLNHIEKQQNMINLDFLLLKKNKSI